MQPSEKPLFKPRKRNTQKKRKRALESTLDSANAGTRREPDDEKIHHDLLLLKEAQKLREQSRQSGLTPSLLLTSATNSSAAETPDNAIKRNDLADGLQSHFSVEKAGTAVEERMAKYIEEGMRKKFGDRYIDRGLGQSQPRSDSNTQKEDNGKDNIGDDNGEDLKELNAEIFDIPQHLQVEQRRLYDPSEGMPSAGLEETEVVSSSVKDVKGNDDFVVADGTGTGNERDDERNGVVKRKYDLKKSEFGKRGNSKTNNNEIMSGNFSSNFAYHRNEWIETHEAAGRNGSKQQDGRQQRKQRDGKPEHKQGQWSKNDKTPVSKKLNNSETGLPSSSRRHPQHADAGFAERFRKRWKQQ